jgi:hypothetical protein
MVGSFASFGGLGYAAANAQDAATSVTRIVTPAKRAKVEVRATKSAAQDQYGNDTFTPPATKPKVTVKSKVKAKVATKPKVANVSRHQVAAASGELPFTGLGLGATALLGSAFLVLGVFLRRRERRS